MLTKEAWNALLKIIEEPPPRVVFVFATTEPQKIANAAAPILSRVQRFDLRRMSPHDVRERLAVVLAAEKVTAEPDALGMLARAADGSMRDALSLTDQVLSLGTGAITAQLVRDTLGLVHDDEILGLLAIIAERRAADVFTEVARLADHGADFGLLLAGVTDALRGELAIGLGAAVTDLSERMRGALDASKGRFSPPDLLRMLHIAVELEPHFRRSAQQQLLFETVLVRFALLDRTVDLEDVLRGLPAGGSGDVLDRPRPPVERTPERPVAPTVARTAPPRLRDVQRVAEVPREAALASVLADAPPATTTAKALQAIDLNRLAGRWDDVVEAVRSSGRGLVASSLAEATPASVANGIVTVHVASDALQSAIESGADAILAAIQTMFSGVQRVATSRPEPVATPARSAGVAKRMTEGDVIASRVAMLRKGAPLLDAAFDTLDLRLVE